MNYSVDRWNKLHQKPRFRPKYPSESVVRFMNSFFPLDFKSRGSLKILDIGCGGGRHVKLFAENGFMTYGVDFSRTGIIHTKKLLQEHHLTAEITNSTMSDLNYGSKFFDAVISYGVFCYGDSMTMKRSINELYRVLKNNGKGFINLRTTRDYRYGKGKEIGYNTYILDIKETNEFNLEMHFLSENDVYNYFSKFKKIMLEKNEFTINSQTVLNSDWWITIIK